MGNQMQKALEGVEAAINESVLDALEAKLDENPQEDTMLDEGNNSEERESAEEPNAIEALEARLEEQNATIDRLVGIMGKMVTRYGASINEGMEHNTEAFPTEDKEVELPNLKDIKLG